jgi:hypothetical protein
MAQVAERPAPELGNACCSYNPRVAAAPALLFDGFVEDDTWWVGADELATQRLVP